MSKSLSVNLIGISSFFAYLLPISLLTGPFLPDLFISIISLIFLLIVIIDGKKKYFQNNFFYFFIAFYLYINLSSFFSKESYFAFQSTIFYFRFGIFALALWHLIDEQSNFIEIFKKSLVSVFIIALIDSYVQLYFGHGIFGFTSSDSSRMTLLLDDESMLGQYLARLMPLVAALIIYNSSANIKNYIFIFVLLVLTDISIYISGERTAFALLIIATLIIILFSKNFRAVRIASLSISLLIIIFITLFNPEIRERNIDHTISQITQNADVELQEGNENSFSKKFNLFSRSHETLFFTAIRIFEDNLIIGSGPNTFRIFCESGKYKLNSYSCSTHPHNSFIQLLSETGFIGIFMYGFILIYFVRNIYLHVFRKKIMQDHEICLFACILITLWPFFPTQNFFNNYINVIYYLPIGFYLHTIYSIQLKLNDELHRT